MKTFQIIIINFLFIVCQLEAQIPNTDFVDIRSTLGISTYYLNEKKLSNKELFRKIQINDDSKKLFIASRFLLFTSNLFFIVGVGASIGQFTNNHSDKFYPALFWSGLGICYAGMGGIYWSFKIEKKSVKEYNNYLADVNFELRRKVNK